MPAYAYTLVDVFTRHPFEGNALAVFTDPAGLDGATMQRIARELNLSETVFLLPPVRGGSVARARIFTPAKEMKFAGHPTVGAAFVLVNLGRAPSNGVFTLDEEVGPIEVTVDRGEDGAPLIWLTTPPIEWGPTYDRGMAARSLGLDASDLLPMAPQWLSAGNPTIYIALKDESAVNRAWCDLAGATALRGGTPEPTCVFVFTPTPGGAYSRMFAPEYGIPEDPATGSSTGPLVAYMQKHGLAPTAPGTTLVSEQGMKMGRRSLLHARVTATGIDVGGYVTPVGEGVLRTR